jgi:hypothetical protein
LQLDQLTSGSPAFDGAGETDSPSDFSYPFAIWLYVTKNRPLHLNCSSVQLFVYYRSGIFARRWCKSVLLAVGSRLQAKPSLGTEHVDPCLSFFENENANAAARDPSSFSNASVACVFSMSYKTLFPEPVSFHIHAKPPGCTVWCRVTSGASCVFSNLPPLGFSLPSFHARRPLFSEACSLFRKNTGGMGWSA